MAWESGSSELESELAEGELSAFEVKTEDGMDESMCERVLSARILCFDEEEDVKPRF